MSHLEPTTKRAAAQFLEEHKGWVRSIIRDGTGRYGTLANQAIHSIWLETSSEFLRQLAIDQKLQRAIGSGKAGKGLLSATLRTIAVSCTRTALRDQLRSQRERATLASSIRHADSREPETSAPRVDTTESAFDAALQNRQQSGLTIAAIAQIFGVSVAIAYTRDRDLTARQIESFGTMEESTSA